MHSLVDAPRLPKGLIPKALLHWAAAHTAMRKNSNVTPKDYLCDMHTLLNGKIDGIATPLISTCARKALL